MARRRTIRRVPNRPGHLDLVKEHQLQDAPETSESDQEAGRMVVQDSPIIASHWPELCG